MTNKPFLLFNFEFHPIALTRTNVTFLTLGNLNIRTGGGVNFF